MTLYRGPGGTGSATSDADTTLYQDFLNQTIAARDAALQAEINAELAETNAETAETNAETAETNAETAATNAASSASAAASSASSASTSASNASTSASAAATSATNAASSASSASSSASAASTSASNAATSATNAANSASSASTSATSAANSASTATTQATNAASSATAAASSASSASTSATNAANSASSASTSATNAANSATSAAASATAAAASAASIDASTLVRLTGDQTIGGTKTFSSNPIISAGTVNGVAYLNGSKVLTSGSSLVFDGTNLGVGTSSTLGNSTVNAVLGFVARNSGASMGYFQTYNANAGVDLKTWRFGGDGSGNLVFETVNDAYSSATQRLSLSSSGNLTLPAGTANGVAYLNGSKVLTTGSALTFDGSFLGIGVSPGVKLDVGGSIRAIDSGAVPFLYLNNGTSQHSISNNAGTMPFAISGGEQMRLTSTGLGIGTSSPGAKLDVRSGATTFGAQISTSGTNTYTPTGSTSLAAANLQILGGNASGACSGMRISHSGNFELFFGAVQEAGGAGAFVWQGYSGSAYAERMRLDSSGNLGLGVTPSAWSGIGSAFELKGNAYIASTSQVLALATNCFFNGSSWLYKSTSNASRYETVFGENRWFTAPSGTAGNAISFTQAMTLDASGNLGIGTSSPQARFHVRNNLCNIYLNPVSNAEARIQAEGETAGVGTAIAFYTYNGSANGDRARIDSSGLILDPSGAGGSYLRLNTSSGGDGHILLQRAGANRWQITSGATNALQFYNYTAASESARIDSSGNLLVGKTAADNSSPGVWLYNNSAQAGRVNIAKNTSGLFNAIANYFSNTYVGGVNYDNTSTSFPTSSDIRLKKDIVDAGSASAKIDQIRIVAHGWKHDDATVEFGVIAQELINVAPQAVSVGDDGEEAQTTWGVDYSKLVPMLIKAHQEQQAIINAQETALNQLKARLDAANL